MVEGGALEISEEDIVEALSVAQKGIRELIGAQEELVKAGSSAADKMEWTKAERRPTARHAGCKALADAKIKEAINQKDKHGAHRRPWSA